MEKKKRNIVPAYCGTYKINKRRFRRKTTARKKLAVKQRGGGKNPKNDSKKNEEKIIEANRKIRNDKYIKLLEDYFEDEGKNRLEKLKKEGLKKFITHNSSTEHYINIGGLEVILEFSDKTTIFIYPNISEVNNIFIHNNSTENSYNIKLVYTDYYDAVNKIFRDERLFRGVVSEEPVIASPVVPETEPPHEFSNPEYNPDEYKSGYLAVGLDASNQENYENGKGYTYVNDDDDDDEDEEQLSNGGKRRTNKRKTYRKKTTRKRRRKNTHKRKTYRKK